MADKIKWEVINSQNYPFLSRAKVPGGWLVCAKTSNGTSITFYPDPNHTWDGYSLP